MNIIKANERGHFDFGWLETHHSFSFGDYYDPKKMGYRSLRVINEDIIRAGEGFPTHGHRDMEIITYIISGALAHKDSTGNSEVIRPGDVQRMTAGKGIQHSEFNHLKDSDTHLLQIWILPSEKNLQPGYEQKNFSSEIKNSGLHLVASQDGRKGSVKIHQDADLYVGNLLVGQSKSLDRRRDRGYWIQVIKGSLDVNGVRLQRGDGGSIEENLTLTTTEGPSEFLLFDLGSLI